MSGRGAGEFGTAAGPSECGREGERGVPRDESEFGESQGEGGETSGGRCEECGGEEGLSGCGRDGGLSDEVGGKGHLA